MTLLPSMRTKEELLQDEQDLLDEIERLREVNKLNVANWQMLYEYQKAKIEWLRELLLRYLPKHDTYDHNDYLNEREQCEICQLRKELNNE